MQFSYRLGFVLASTLALSSCEKHVDSAETHTGQAYEFTTNEDIVQRDDGLTYLKGATEPYHGPVIRTHPERGLRYFAMYQNGMLNGPEMTFYDNGLLRRITDFRDGNKDRNRDYYENGNPWRDAMFEHDVAWGRHLKWHENGRLGFVGVIHQDEESMKWDGHITDHDENGEIVVDAIFEKGRYVGGKFSLEKIPKPKPTGKRWLWEQ
jgi:antitoxin component YwqK of YwqJK toxin-antitoxin module